MSPHSTEPQNQISPNSKKKMSIGQTPNHAKLCDKKCLRYLQMKICAPKKWAKIALRPATAN